MGTEVLAESGEGLEEECCQNSQPGHKPPPWAPQPQLNFLHGPACSSHVHVLRSAALQWSL